MARLNDIETLFKANYGRMHKLAKAAVKAITARNPISVIEKKGYILVEALQKGKYRYSGKLVNEFGDPVLYLRVYKYPCIDG